jgi:hypothetical protein
MFIQLGEFFLAQVPYLLERVKLESWGTLVSWLPTFSTANAEAAGLAVRPKSLKAVIHGPSARRMTALFWGLPIIGRSRNGRTLGLRWWSMTPLVSRWLDEGVWFGLADLLPASRLDGFFL